MGVSGNFHYWTDNFIYFWPDFRPNLIFLLEQGIKLVLSLYHCQKRDDDVILTSYSRDVNVLLLSHKELDPSYQLTRVCDDQTTTTEVTR